MISRMSRSALALLALATTFDGARAQSLDVNLATLAEPNQKTAEVSTEQLRRILADGSAMVIDTRSRQEFEAGHIPGAHMLDARPITMPALRRTLFLAHSKQRGPFRSEAGLTGAVRSSLGGLIEALGPLVHPLWVRTA